MEATPLSAFKITGTRIDGFVGEGITEVVIPEGITEIQHYAFCPVINSAAGTIQSIYIPDTVTIIGQSAFSSAKNLVKVRLSSNLKKLAKNTFTKCENLQSLYLPYGLQVIGWYSLAFTGITALIIPNSVTTLEDGAFWACNKLRTITIPESVQNIGKDVFRFTKNATICTTAGSCAEKFAKEHDVPVKIITSAAMQELLSAEKNTFPKYPLLDKPASGKSDKSASLPDDMPDALREALDRYGLTIDDFDEVIRKANESVDPAEGSSQVAKQTNQYVSPRMREIQKQIAELGQIQPTQEKENKNGFASIVDAGKNWLRQRNAPSKGDEVQYRNLIRFVKFCKKVAPMADYNYGIDISYEVLSKYTSNSLYASFKVCDFNEIQFAREFAVDKAHLDISKSMIRLYYEDISKAAGLRQEDWPCCIDADTFRDVLRGEFWGNRFTVIPDERDEDTLTLQVVGGISYSNAAQVHASVIKLLNYHFPELNIKRGYAVSPTSMRIHFKI